MTSTASRCFVGLLATIVVGVGLLDIVGEAAGQNSARRWTAPGDAARRTNPLATRPDTAAGGRKLFVQRCVNCHGHDGEGTDKGPDLSATHVQVQTDGALFWKITQGNTRSGMPTFSYLPELQRWQLVLHLRRLGTQPPANR